jgi:pyruvate dehydrogenase E2 component (dihydrolipoamide acetyltransferase)
MMHDVRMPKLGLTMTEGSVSEWMVAPGDAVTKGQVLLVIETEKVAHDVEAEHDGTLVDIVVPAGETVDVGTLLGRIESTSAVDTPVAAAAANDAPATDADVRAASLLPPPESPAAETIARTARGKRVVATPLARKHAAAAGVDLRDVAGSGPGGRVKAQDVDATAKAAGASKPPGTFAAHARRVRPSPAHVVAARRLAQSKREIPHFYVASEAEVSTLEAQRAAHNANAPNARLTLNTLLVAAVARALADLPDANAVWIDDELAVFDTVDVGIAVHTPRGLYVPVLRDAGAKPLAAIAHDSAALVARARAGELGADEMAGGAITVSNAGMHDVTYMTPIIAPAQSAILGAGSIREVFRPDAEGRPALRRELCLVLAADHRVFDGVSALQLLNRIIQHLEHPATLFGL